MLIVLSCRPATNDLTISETEKERIVRVARGCFLGIYVFLRLNLEIFCDFDGLAPVCAGVFTRNEPSQAAKLCPPFPTCSSRFSAVHATGELRPAQHTLARLTHKHTHKHTAMAYKAIEFKITAMGILQVFHCLNSVFLLLLFFLYFLNHVRDA